MSDYTPTSDYVRTIYGRCPVDSLNGGKPNPTPAYAEAQFDRWLASEKAKAWDEGRAARYRPELENPYR